MVTVPPNTYTGPVNMSINGTPQGDALVNANVAQAAKMGVTLPGPAAPASTPDATQTTVLHNPDGSVNTQAGAGAAPAASTASSYYPRYTAGEQAASDYQNGGSFQAPKSQADIEAEMRTSAQSEIDALNKSYDSQLADQRIVNEGRDRSTSSVSTLTGLAGSTEANIAQGQTSALNAKDNERINNERALAVSSVFSKIRSAAVDEARAQRTEARQSAQDIMASRTQRATEATQHLTTLAQSGATIDGLKNTDPAAYDYLSKQVGGEDMLKALMVINRPKNTIVGTPQRVGDHYVQSYQNPITGKVEMESIPIPGGLPPEYKQFQKMGDNLVAFPDNWNGDVSQLKTIVGQPSMQDQLNQKLLGLHIQGASLDNQQKAMNLQEGTPESLAQSLVDGRMAPSELSKRITGSAGYNSVLAAADKYSMETTGKHFDISKANRDYKFATNVNTQNTLNFLSSLVGDASTGAKGNIDDLLAASDKVNRTDFPAINSAEFQALYQSGDPNVVAYVTTATEVADQVAKILQGGGSGSGTSDAKLKQAISLFNTSFSKKQLASTVSAIKPLLSNRARGMINDNPYLSDYADQFGVKASNPNTGATPITAPDGTQVIITD